MITRKLFRWMLFLLVCTLSAGHANAADERWYITPGLSYVLPDDDRSAENNTGLSIGIGKAITPSWNLELGIVSVTLKQTSGSLEFKQRGLQLDGLRFLSRKPSYSIYGLVGVGALETKFSNTDGTHPMANVGIGIMSPLWQEARVGFRSDIRYRIDENNLLQENRFGDWVFNINLVLYCDAEKPQQAVMSKPTPEPAPVITKEPAPKPATIVLNDSDGDGVPDIGDQCPNTPAGTKVDEKGCELDSDKDGVVDSKDICPNTPIGTRVDANGCELDSDKDGVVNSKDICPNTPIGTRVDANGCELDSDKDGVVDSKDICPNTPIGTRVDANGCELDSDKDGVVDSKDICPNTPTGTRVDANGCELDSDKDGVVNSGDACPDTALGTPVDPKGCPVLTDADGDGVADNIDLCPQSKPGEKVGPTGCAAAEVISLEGVNFEKGSDLLLPESMVILDTVAATLMRNPEVFVEVAGHTDNVGDAGKNKKLSQKRADAVAQYLVTKGVVAANLRTEGYGPNNAVGDNKTPEGRAMNRRVELRLLDR